MVRGDAGIGKSALLQRSIDAASGFTILHATGMESEMELPFAALHSLCASLLDRVDSLPDPQRNAVSTAFGLTTGPSPDRLSIGLAVLNLLSAASEDHPLLCVVDDAQWLDRESTLALTFVGRRLLAESVGMVFATRSSTADLAAFPELVLEGLHDRDAHTLLSGVLHVPLDERVRDRIVAETHGNPLALMEWPRGLTSVELAGGFGLPAVMPLSGQIEESFRRRLAELPPPTQRFLTVCAAEPTGDPFIVWRAASSLGVVPDDASPATDAGLIEIGVRTSFRHSLVRSAAYAAAPLADRQAAHRALGEATDPDVDPDRRAWHRALGSPGPDEAIAVELEQSAGHVRARGGLAAAGALLERSVALSTDPNRRAERILGAAATNLEAGAFDVVPGLLAAAETAPLDEMSRVIVVLLRGHYLYVTNNGGREAPRLLAQAAQQFEAIDVGLAHRAYLHALGASMNVNSETGHDDVDEIARRADACPASAEPSWTDLLSAALAQTLLTGPVTAAPALRRGLDASRREHRAADAFQWLGYACASATELWDIAGLHEFASMHTRSAQELGAMTDLPAALNTLAYAVALEGELQEAAGLVEESKQIDDITDGRLVLWGTATLAALRGTDRDTAILADLVAQARAAGMEMVLGKAQWATAMLFNGQGQYEKAQAAGEAASRHRFVWGNNPGFHELVESATRSGNPTLATTALRDLEAVVDPDGTDWALGVLARSRALLADSAAEDLYRVAIDRLARTPLRPELARSHLLYGEWLRREGRRVDAREQLRSAHELFVAMGMHAFAERARHELSATGETLRKRTVAAYDELTPQEAHIARLAAEGLTNPEIGTKLFISPRTVEWHLRKVFTKLGITSRRQLRETFPRPPG